MTSSRCAVRRTAAPGALLLAALTLAACAKGAAAPGPSTPVAPSTAPSVAATDTGGTPTAPPVPGGVDSAPAETGGAPPVPPADGGGPIPNQPKPVRPSGSTTLTGTVTNGVEAGCLLLSGYQLMGGPRDVLKSGKPVRVTGHPQPDLASYCQQGIPFVVERAEPA